MSVTSSVINALHPGRLARAISAMRPHPLRKEARDEIAALRNGLEAFAARYGLYIDEPGQQATMSEISVETAISEDTQSSAELDERLRSLVQNALAYLQLLDEGKQPQEPPDFVHIVRELEKDGSASGKAIAAKAELAGLLRKLDQLDNHWLAEARRNRRRRRVGRDINGDNIDDAVQGRRDEQKERSAAHAEELAARAAERREDLAKRLDDDANAVPDVDADSAGPDSGYDDAFWRRHGEEITLLLIALDYCGNDADPHDVTEARALAQLPTTVSSPELLERLRNLFEGRYLEYDLDYDPQLLLPALRAMRDGMSIEDAMTLNQEHLLNNRGIPETVLEPEPERVRAQAAVLDFGTPASIQAQVPWRPVDPVTVAHEIRNGQHVE